jgi:hypothetical protein
MPAERVVIPGVVRNGLVVPQSKARLPEGAAVEIVLSPADVSPELEAEFVAWDRASDEAWRLIDQWEQEE